MFERILVATDGSPLSAKAAQSAIELAAKHGAELVVMTVVPRYPMTYLDGAMTYSPEEIEATEKRWEATAQVMLDEIAASGQARGVRVKTVAIHSDHVAEAVIDAARTTGSNLIVMASHGRKGLKKLLLGSETQHVLTHTELPVLVLR